MNPRITCHAILRFSSTAFTKPVHSIFFSPRNNEGFHTKILSEFLVYPILCVPPIQSHFQTPLCNSDSLILRCRYKPNPDSLLTAQIRIAQSSSDGWRSCSAASHKYDWLFNDAVHMPLYFVKRISLQHRLNVSYESLQLNKMYIFYFMYVCPFLFFSFILHTTNRFNTT